MSRKVVAGLRTFAIENVKWPSSPELVDKLIASIEQEAGDE